MNDEYQNLPPNLKEAVIETASSMTPKTVEEICGSLNLTDNGSIKNSVENCLTVLENDPVLSGAICYNCLTERVNIVKPLGWTKTTLAVTDTDTKYLIYYFEKNYGITSEKKIELAVSVVADRHQYHPSGII